MNLMLFAIAVSYITKIAAEKIACDGLVFHKVYYDEELLFSSFGNPYNLVYHKFSGILFFSHTVTADMHIVDFAIEACHVDTKDCSHVKGIEGGYAIAYDYANDDVYMGGHDGIYTYNFLTKEAEFFDAKGKSIWALFISKNFYYIEYPNQKLFVYTERGFVEVAEAVGIEVDHFLVSRANQIYFANKTALFKVLRPGGHTVMLSDEVVVKQIAEDSYGEIYFACNDGIYLEDRIDIGISKVASIENCYGITFDHADNVIYSDNTSIKRLVPSNHSELCYHAITQNEINSTSIIMGFESDS